MDAAEATGVQRVVYLSFPPAAVDSPFQRAKREVEDRLRVANLEHSILQPGNFMESGSHRISDSISRLVR